jgi:hypothetical protein
MKATYSVCQATTARLQAYNVVKQAYKPSNMHMNNDAGSAEKADEHLVTLTHSHN